MRNQLSTLLLLLTLQFFAPSWASDACSEVAITAKADVSVSDGSTYQAETAYHTLDNALFTQRANEGTTTVAVEGPASWVGTKGKITAGTEFHKLFALGHQFHALLVHFEDIHTDIRTTAAVDFGGLPYPAMTGTYPYGGVTHLVRHPDALYPEGFVFEFPGDIRITVRLEDWLSVDDMLLPHRLVIDDGDRVFTYHYTDISISEDHPLWFMTAAGKTRLDEVDLYRLHRKLLIAHCLGDADMIADLSTDKLLVAGRGTISHPGREDMRARFRSLFESVDYTEYHDLTTPELGIAEGGDIGWAGVEVLTKGVDRNTGAPFETQWAWIMLARKIDGVWYHAGNGSNARP